MKLSIQAIILDVILFTSCSYWFLSFFVALTVGLQTLFHHSYKVAIPLEQILNSGDVLSLCDENLFCRIFFVLNTQLLSKYTQRVLVKSWKTQCNQGKKLQRFSYKSNSVSFKLRNCRSVVKTIVTNLKTELNLQLSAATLNVGRLS